MDFTERFQLDIDKHIVVADLIYLCTPTEFDNYIEELEKRIEHSGVTHRMYSEHNKSNIFIFKIDVDKGIYEGGITIDSGYVGIKVMNVDVSLSKTLYGAYEFSTKSFTIKYIDKCLSLGTVLSYDFKEMKNVTKMLSINELDNPPLPSTADGYPDDAYFTTDDDEDYDIEEDDDVNDGDEGL